LLKLLKEKNEFGYDAKLGDYKNMISEGIIDPTKVTRVALENAASVSGMLLTTECVITEIKKEEPAMPQMPNSGMGGMM